MKQWLLLALVMPGVYQGYSQDSWKGRQCAVVLTYDDGYDQQLDNALPVLDSLGLKATFYLSAFFPAVKNRIQEWKKVAASGHELGNHTLYHPCTGNIPGREWVQSENDLGKYTVQRMVNEISMTNVFLKALDGKDRRTFAYPCADTKIGDSAYFTSLKNEFAAARNVRSRMHCLQEVDLYDVDCYMVNGETSGQMIEWVKKALKTHSLLVILFHGVGGGNPLNVLPEEHRCFLYFLKQHEDDIWVAPMTEVADYIRSVKK